MTLVTSLFLLLAFAHALGTLCVRLRQPALAGHMIAGIVLGPSVLAWLEPGAVLGAVSDVAVLFVVLTAGLEMRLQHVMEVFRGRGVLALAIGFTVPALAGGAVAAAFSLPPMPALVVALCIAVTALPVALQILRGFDMLRSRIARVAISGALLSDILVFMILGVLIELGVGERLHTPGVSAGLAIAKLAGLIAVIVIAQLACARLMRLQRVRRADEKASVNAPTGRLAFALLFVLALGALSEVLGFHFAIGAFFAAMMITPELIGERPFECLEGTCEVLTASLFGPLFLAYQGMQFSLQTLSQPSFVVSLTVVAVAAKLLSGYVVGRLQRMNTHDAWGVGIVMNARGVMELVVASIAFRAGLVDGAVFSALLVIGLITTVLTPLMLKRWQSHAPALDASRDVPPAR